MTSSTIDRQAILALVSAAALAACGGGKQGGNAHDWSRKPLSESIEDQANEVKFRISAPAGMKKDDHGGGVTVSWEVDQKDNFSDPHFAVAYAAIPPEDLDGFISDAMLDDKDVIARKETTADGFVLVYHTRNNGIVRAEVLKRKGDVNLVCRASQAHDGGVPNPEATMAWLEGLCATLTIL